MVSRAQLRTSGEEDGAEAHGASRQLWKKEPEPLLSGPNPSCHIRGHFAFHSELEVPDSGGKAAERQRIPS